MSETTDTRNWTKIRIAVGIIAIIPTAIATAFTFSALNSNGNEFLTSWFGAGFVLVPATVAALCWWFVSRGHYAVSRVRMMYALIGAMGLCVIAFLGGVIGPLMLTPDANQGPLLGFFITGPLGFVAGALLGTLYSFIRVRPTSA